MTSVVYDDQNLQVLGEEVHVRQKPGVQKNWQDSVVLVWYDEDNKVGGFHRIGHEPNVEDGGKAVLWNVLVGPEGMQKRVQYVPLRKEDLLESGGFGGGDDTCRSEYVDGEHIWTIKEDGVTARLAFKDFGPNVDCFPKRGIMKQGFSAAHFDIPGTVSGTMKMKGSEYTIKGLGIRDHGWGPRDWSTVYSHRWVVGTCGPEFSFFAVSWHAIDDTISNFGWIVRGKNVAMAKSVDILTYTEMDGAMNRGGHVKFFLTTSEEFEVELTPYPGAKASVCYHHGVACVDRLCSFKCGEWKGFSDFESTANIQYGKRKPTKFIDGIIDDGWFPNDSK